MTTDECTCCVAISSNAWALDIQALDAIDWLGGCPDTSHVDAVLAQFPEVADLDTHRIDAEELGLDPDYVSWLVDAIENTGAVWWEDGEPFAETVCLGHCKVGA